LVLSALGIWSAPALAQGVILESHHCLNGCPIGPAGVTKLVDRHIYILANNPETKFAEWVAYEVRANWFGPTRKRSWRRDPWLDASETLEPKDYTGANAALKTDRGHQAPLASFAGTPYWHETNYLSNITPQGSGLNQGPWVDLETATRDLAAAVPDGRVHVITGPLYEREMAALPQADEPHAVPSGYWKIVVLRERDRTRAATFVFPQEVPRSDEHCAAIYRGTIGDIEARAGITLFPTMGAATRVALETDGGLAAVLGCANKPS
jgi:endonuclease G, mitochondrial